jgi:hypothetical protein
MAGSGAASAGLAGRARPRCATSARRSPRAAASRSAVPRRMPRWPVGSRWTTCRPGRLLARLPESPSSPYLSPPTGSEPDAVARDLSRARWFASEMPRSAWPADRPRKPAHSRRSARLLRPAFSAARRPDRADRPIWSTRPSPRCADRHGADRHASAPVRRRSAPDGSRGSGRGLGRGWAVGRARTSRNGAGLGRGHVAWHICSSMRAESSPRGWSAGRGRRRRIAPARPHASPTAGDRRRTGGRETPDGDRASPLLGPPAASHRVPCGEIPTMLDRLLASR